MSGAFDLIGDIHGHADELVALLRLGRDAEAESVWREDLERNRENGWALAGLAAALTRQGKTAEAEQVRSRLAVAWARADLGLERVAAGN